MVRSGQGSETGSGARRLRVVVSGAGGLVGASLTRLLSAGGHDVQRLVRRPGGQEEASVFYDPDSGSIEAGKIDGADAVVHLAGENIAARRWTDRQKARIRDSRVRSTALIATTLAKLDRPPAVLVNASAIGYYGDRGNETLDESAEPGTGFLADACVAWEEATRAAEGCGIRVVRLRIGVVLSAAGGALARMLPPFRLGLGGRLGGGEQYMSWIGLDDLTGIIHHCLSCSALAGPVNAVAPHPVRNAEFTRVLAGVVRRPAILPAPAWAIRLVLGEMGSELLLAGARVLPRRLEAAGFTFRHPQLESSLRFELRGDR